MRKNILTVYCLAFNHERYLEKTLNGFVEQVTEYPYKVIVHDDASTDSTKKIIERFAKDYPDIIVPIYQKENQYSKGKSIFEEFIQPHLEGKYIAVCEGDDYWCDVNKLQKQISYMEENPDCSLCVHNTEMINENGKSKKVYFNASNRERDYSAEEIIECGGGGLFHTSSFVMRTDLRVKKPKDFSISDIGDYTLAIYLALNGRVHYIPTVMSKYRVGSVNSWVKKNSSNIQKYKIYAQKAINDLERINGLTNYEYSDSFEIAKRRFEYNCCLKERKIIDILKNKEYRLFFEENDLKKRLKILIKIFGGKV